MEFCPRLAEGPARPGANRLITGTGEMDTQDWRRASGIFAEVVAQRRDRWATLLDELCGEDTGIRHAVERLLAAHESEDAPIESLDAAIGSALNEGIAPLPVGTWIGPFRVAREIGSGGMGRVYLGERDIDGGTQLVALKLPAVRLGGRVFRDRLRKERRALARLEHPGIARLIDAGETHDGRPYFAMEYVPEAVPITTWCDSKRLGLERRIRLFLEVCDAVQHAHNNLIVHRDIKPGNVLVSPDGAARLLDFGIAKAMPGAEDGPTGETAADERFFSPPHSAPEQLQGRATGIGTDVYALGVLLHQLMVGVLPQEPAGRSFADYSREVVEQEPIPASARVMEESSIEAATLRGFPSIAAHARALADDIDLIVAKALRRRPEHRYSSVERFADDLEAMIAGRPIGLRSGDRWYRWSRFARRNALPLSLGAATVLVAVAFGATATLQSQRIAEERDLALAQERRATLERDRADAVNRFLVSAFNAADPTRSLGRKVTAQEILGSAIAELQRNADVLPEVVRLSLADSLAEVSWSLDMNAEGAALAALARTESLMHGPPEAAAQLRQALREIRVALRAGETAAARASREIARRAVVRESLPFALRFELALAEAEVDAASGRWREVLDGIDSVREEIPDDVDAANRRTALAAHLANAHRALRDNAAANAELERALREIGDRPADEPARIRLELLLSAALRRTGDVDRALAAAQRAAAGAERIYGPTHTATASAWTTLANARKAAKRLPEAETDYARAEAVFSMRLGADHPSVLSLAFNRIGIALDQGRQGPEIETAQRDLIADASRVLGREHPNTLIFTQGYVRYLLDRQRYREAEPLIRDSITALERLAFPRGAMLAEARVALAIVLLARGEAGAARRLVEEARDVVQRELGPDSWSGRALHRVDEAMR